MPPESTPFAPHPQIATSSTKVRPLWPKAPPVPPRLGRKPIFRLSDSRHRAPRCPACLQQDCKLPAHKAKAQGPNDASKSSCTPKHNSRALALFATSYAYAYTRIFVGDGSAGVTAKSFAPLPMPDNMVEFDKLELSRLFYEFFSIGGRTVINIPIPSELPSELYLSPFFLPAMSDTALCLAILTLSAASRAVRKKQPVTTVEILGLLDISMRQLRAQMSQDQISDNEIVAATFLWEANSLLGDLNAMKCHAESVYALVKRRGGLEKLGLAGAVSRLIVSVDFCNAILLAEKPQYKSQDESWSEFRPPPVSEIYGEASSKGAANIERDLNAQVKRLCLDSCRAVEVLEAMLGENASVAAYLHCFYELLSLGTRTATLCASFTASSTMNECVCITTQLVVMLVFYTPPQQHLLVTTQAGRAISALEKLFVLTVWEDSVSAFIWILSVLVMLPHEYEGKELALGLLHQALSSHFGEENWPSDWEDRFLAILMQFVWSRIKFTDYFASICHLVKDRGILLVEGTSQGIARTHHESVPVSFHRRLSALSM